MRVELVNDVVFLDSGRFLSIKISVEKLVYFIIITEQWVKMSPRINASIR